ncbi:ABC transporter C family protein [Artemisia annua]|uniref:ABC transporter C family protein n=1 Tax=Artemisia annua TaxID=35608 RepID=A0A2U1QBQ5_ARTAN|nr:ABC transporter C family protein [Artemisia annua]
MGAQNVKKPMLPLDVPFIRITYEQISAYSNVGKSAYFNVANPPHLKRVQKKGKRAEIFMEVCWASVNLVLEKLQNRFRGCHCAKSQYRGQVTYANQGGSITYNDKPYSKFLKNKKHISSVNLVWRAQPLGQFQRLLDTTSVTFEWRHGRQQQVIGFTDSIFNAPMVYFNSTPVGRILTSGYYQPTARELIRINGTAKAPVMYYASDTSLGVATIQAFKWQQYKHLSGNNTELDDWLVPTKMRLGTKKCCTLLRRI